MDESVRAAAAQRLLADDVFNEAFAEIRADLLRAWENTPPEGVERRESAWVSLKAVELLKSRLQAYADSGKIAAARSR